MIEHETLKGYASYWEGKLDACLTIFEMKKVIIDMEEYIHNGGVIRV